MKVNITIDDEFKRNAKRLSKKYRSLKEDLIAFHEDLLENPFGATTLVAACARFAWPSVPRERGKEAERVC